MKLTTPACFPAMFAALLLLSPALADQKTLDSDGEATPKEIVLFNGESLDAWKTASGQPVSKGWQVKGGELVRTERTGAIFAENPFEDFELEFEWKIVERGNSGIKYRGRNYEKGLFGRPGWLGLEYQLLGETKSSNSSGSAAAIYSLYEPNDKKKLNPPQQYNHSRVVVRGEHIEHWLNGEKVAEATVGSDDWKTRVAKSKFAKVEGFAENRLGQIQIQDHGSQVWFRKVILRSLESEDGQEK